MTNRKWFVGLAATMAAVGFAAIAFSQTPAATKPADDVREAKRKARLEYVRGIIGIFKERLAAPDEEWKALQPRIERVMLLTYSGTQGDYAESRTMLLTLAGGTGGTPQEFKEAIEAYRDAKAAAETAYTKNQKDFDAARKELRELLTPRQEAVMIILGVLDAPAPTGSATGPAATSQPTDEAKEEKRKERLEWMKKSAEQLREPLGCTNDEWKVLEPKVVRLMLATWIEEEAGVADKRIALSNLVNKKDATEKEYKAAIDAFAEAIQVWKDRQAKNQKDLAEAKKDLRELLTAKQEAILIFRRLLD